MVTKDGVAYLQAGGGIVFGEFEEQNPRSLTSSSPYGCTSLDASRVLTRDPRGQEISFEIVLDREHGLKILREYGLYQRHRLRGLRHKIWLFPPQCFKTDANYAIYHRQRGV
jgi:hypothetical protein